jgi:endogenous inhibitor of DNA gyrase (YacG/DUF329 family)
MSISMAKRTRSLGCPICKTKVKAAQAEYPFCSERCRLLDLGRWASGAYVISSPLEEESQAVPSSEPDDDRD